MSTYAGYTREELEAMPTISTGWTDDLKVDTGRMRIWVSRLTVEDGVSEDHEITIEQFDPVSGRWS